MDSSSEVTFINQGHDFWDQTLIKDLLKDYQGERDVFVVPGAISDPDDVSMEMHDHPKVTVVITSDEENKFHVKGLYHPDMRVYVTYPNKELHQDVDGYLPIGYAPNCRKLVKENGMSAKSLDWFFAGQDTNSSRHACVEALKTVADGTLETTQGFAQGLEYKEYMKVMCRAKIIPCPAGPFSPDSFRLYEALEAGCIPIVENREFWTMLFGEVPFPVVYNWVELPELINHYKDRPDINNKCQAWWLLKKRELKSAITGGLL